MQIKIKDPSIKPKQRNILDTRRLSLDEYREKFLENTDYQVLKNFFLPRYSSEYRIGIHSFLGVWLGSLTGYATYFTSGAYLGKECQLKYTLKYCRGSIGLVVPYTICNEVYYGVLKRQGVTYKYIYTNTLAALTLFTFLHYSTRKYYNHPLFTKLLFKYVLVITVSSLTLDTFITFNRFIVKNNLEHIDYTPKKIFRDPSTKAIQ